MRGAPLFLSISKQSFLGNVRDVTHLRAVETVRTGVLSEAADLERTQKKARRSRQSEADKQ